MLEKTDWRKVPDDPDPTTDLGYDIIDLDVVPTSVEGREQLLVLPTDEDLLREDAFMVIDKSDICNLNEKV